MDMHVQRDFAFDRASARYLEPVATAQPQARAPRTRRTWRVGRYAALLAYLSAAALVLLLAAPAYRDRPSGAVKAAAPPPARPAHLPAFIPSWAWKLSAWHATAGSARGRRPHGAPHPLPRWYWTWHAWRMKIQSPA